MLENDFLVVNDVAKKLKVSLQYVRTLIRNGQLEGTKIGKQWVTTQDLLNKYISDYNVIIEPDDYIRPSKDIPKIVALSFFSGAMGLDIGMKNAGIKALLACENNKYCRMTIKKNNKDIALIGDINNFSSNKILEMANIPKNIKIDVIFGGPPCQAFSTAGKQKGFNDNRGNVFLKYLDIISEIKPTYVVIENVRGILSTPYPYKSIKQPIKGGAMMLILDKLKDIGYTISFNLYNAAYFGVPQIRERLVIIAKLGCEKVNYLTPTHSNDLEHNLCPWKTFGEAVENIKNKKQNYIFFPEARLKYYRLLTEGQYWKDLPENIQQEALGKSFNLGGGKTGFLRRLSFNKPSPTLVTNPTMPATDLAHPIEDRPLSIEEYKCIQGFPDDWIICGPILEQYKQLGNAVPIKLGEAIGKTIIDDMNRIKKVAFSDFPYSRYKVTNEINWLEEMNKKIKIEKERLEKISQFLSLIKFKIIKES